CGVGRPESTTDDPAAVESDRIVGGRPVPDQANYSWMAWIVSSPGGFCGGALINDRYLLTSSSCVSAGRSGFFWVTLGDLDISISFESQLMQTSATAIVHPRYDPGTRENDVALLRLETPVDFSAHPHIRPLCLSSGVDPAVGTRLIISGWGHTAGSDSGNSGELLEATTYVISQESCRENFGSNITENFICTQSAGKNICFGDCGGPLMYRNPAGYYESAGIASFFEYQCSAEYGGVFAKTANYVEDFIKGNTKDAQWCQTPSGVHRHHSSLRLRLFWFLLLASSAWK
ncbi:unnamed protein product, partial [Darwinula stevensoni]